MSHPLFRKTALAAALVSFSIAFGASAQTSPPSGGTAATPAPPAAGSTGMDKGAGTSAAAPATTTGKSRTDAKTASLPSGERKFLETAARHGIAEVELGKLAQQNGGSQQVKDFGRRMVEDHGKANEELKRIAAAKGVTLPNEMDSSHKRKMDRLAKKSGHDFDTAYMDDMVDDHQKDVRDFRGMAKNAKDADVKSFASSTLPTLEQHLQLAKSAEDAVKQAGRNRGTSQAGAGRANDTAARSGGTVGQASSQMPANATAPGTSPRAASDRTGTAGAANTGAAQGAGGTTTSTPTK